ncbi:hypothetical protein ES708_15348 [subsurface metagenome]
MAREIPIFPLVASKIILPRLSSPLFSACSIMYRATLSFIEPPGFCPSSFANRFIFLLLRILFSFIIGVFPIACNKFEYFIVIQFRIE